MRTHALGSFLDIDFLGNNGTFNLQFGPMNLTNPFLTARRAGETHQASHRTACWRGLLTVVALLLASASTPSRAQAQQQQYLIGSGDILRISVFKNPDLSLDIRVSEAGTISYPLIGSVPVGGLTPSAAERKIGDLLKEGGFVLNPQVNILITTALGGLVSVIGDVRTPGRYAVEAAGGHVSGMLASAGGIGPTGSDRIVVSGMRNGKPFHREIDVVAMSLSGNTADDIALAGGDTLFVNHAPLFYIYGQVQKPGQLPLVRNMTVMQALAAGGGVTGKGTSRGLVRHRRDASGKVKEESVSLDDDVQDQDVIYVKESLF
jgi:polysaccharide biosynthesis/export protein